MALEKQLNILGIRGVPAAHGGFETFAAQLAPFMRDAGWLVSVYCQGEEGVKKPKMWIDEWEGIRRIHFDTRTRGELATMEFDLRSTLNVLSQPGVDLVLGYNTAIFCLLQRLGRRRVAINMDGIEWKRQKWGKPLKAWFWVNEWFGAKLCTKAVADHPQIAAHLASRVKCDSVVIPYGSDTILEASPDPLGSLGIAPNEYFVSIARIEPENSILEIVEAFARAKTGKKLVVLGKLLPGHAYHARVKAAADENTIFPGAIYDPAVVRALRFHCLAYLHGHQVGGTNPSLVEALGAGNAVIARDNKFNRWVAGDDQIYFSDTDTCVAAFTRAATDPDRVSQARAGSRRRHADAFTLDKIHTTYHDELAKLAGASA